MNVSMIFHPHFENILKEEKNAYYFCWSRIGQLNNNISKFFNEKVEITKIQKNVGIMLKFDNLLC